MVTFKYGDRFSPELGRLVSSFSKAQLNFSLIRSLKTISKLLGSIWRHTVGWTKIDQIQSFLLPYNNPNFIQQRQFLKNPPFYFSCSSPYFFFTSKMADSNWGWNEKSENGINLGLSFLTFVTLSHGLKFWRILQRVLVSLVNSRTWNEYEKPWEAAYALK